MADKKQQKPSNSLSDLLFPPVPERFKTANRQGQSNGILFYLEPYLFSYTAPFGYDHRRHTVRHITVSKNKLTWQNLSIKQAGNNGEIDHRVVYAKMRLASKTYRLASYLGLSRFSKRYENVTKVKENAYRLQDIFLDMISWPVDTHTDKKSDAAEVVTNNDDALPTKSDTKNKLNAAKVATYAVHSLLAMPSLFIKAVLAAALAIFNLLKFSLLLPMDISYDYLNNKADDIAESSPILSFISKGFARAVRLISLPFHFVSTAVTLTAYATDVVVSTLFNPVALIRRSINLGKSILNKIIPEAPLKIRREPTVEESINEQISTANTTQAELNQLLNERIEALGFKPTVIPGKAFSQKHLQPEDANINKLRRSSTDFKKIRRRLDDTEVTWGKTDENQNKVQPSQQSHESARCSSSIKSCLQGMFISLWGSSKTHDENERGVELSRVVGSEAHSRVKGSVKGSGRFC